VISLLMAVHLSEDRCTATFIYREVLVKTEKQLGRKGNFNFSFFCSLPILNLYFANQSY